MKYEFPIQQVNKMIREGKLLHRNQLKSGKDYVGLKKYKNKKGYEKLMYHVVVDPHDDPHDQPEEEVYFFECSSFDDLYDKYCPKQEDFEHHFDSKENDNIFEVISMFRELFDKNSITFEEITDETDDEQIFYLDGKYKGEKVRVSFRLYLDNLHFLKILERLARDYSLNDGLHPRFVVMCNDPKTLEDIFRRIKPNHCDWYD